jgi:hypothetical protein
MSRRDGTIVAWHEVPGAAPPQRTVSAWADMVSIGVRTDSVRCDRAAIKRFKFMSIRAYDTILSMANTFSCLEQQLEHHRTRTFQEEYLAFLKKHGAHFDEKYLWD